MTEDERIPVAEILAKAREKNWPTSSISAMASHDLRDESDEEPQTSVWFTPTQPINIIRGTDE